MKLTLLVVLSSWRTRKIRFQGRREEAAGRDGARRRREEAVRVDGKRRWRQKTAPVDRGRRWRRWRRRRCKLVGGGGARRRCE